MRIIRCSPLLEQDHEQNKFIFFITASSVATIGGGDKLRAAEMAQQVKGLQQNPDV